jgi:Tat protein secretion system quality control protein TatD with DNase activity
MGRKVRRSQANSMHSTDEDSDEGQGESIPESPSEAKINLKDLDFAQRRELQRKQEAEKRRSKMKCYLCGKTGHVRRECTGIADDGRGMSRYKGKSDIHNERQKYVARKGRSGSDSHEESSESLVASLEYPEEFIKENGLLYIDAHCDILETIEYLRSGRGKSKVSQKEAIEEYLTATRIAVQRSNLIAVISKTFLTRPNRPWINPMTFDIQDVAVYFVMGLTPTWEVGNMIDRDIAIQSLESAVRDHREVLAIYSSLDTSTEILETPGMDLFSQVSRLQCCCEAAGRLDVPLQIHVRPGAASLDPEQKSVAGTDYARALLELQAAITAATSNHPKLRIHLVGWSGRSSHMMAMLQAFPENLVAIGLDAAVSFSKAEHLHECAFELPLDHLILETSNIIPSNVANTMGRRAFPQSGWWPFIAESFAKYKRTYSIEQVVLAASENTIRLYPPLRGNSTTNATIGDDETSKANVLSQSYVEVSDIDVSH